MLVLLVLFAINTTLVNASFGFNLDVSESKTPLSIGLIDSKFDNTFGFDLEDDSESTFNIGLINSKSQNSKSSEINKGLIIGLTVGLTLLIAIICIILIVIIAIKHKKYDGENYPTDIELSNDDYSIQIDSYNTIDTTEVD